MKRIIILIVLVFTTYVLKAQTNYDYAILVNTYIKDYSEGTYWTDVLGEVDSGYVINLNGGNPTDYSNYIDFETTFHDFFVPNNNDFTNFNIIIQNTSSSVIYDGSSSSGSYSPCNKERTFSYTKAQFSNVSYPDPVEYETCASISTIYTIHQDQPTGNESVICKSDPIVLKYGWHWQYKLLKEGSIGSWIDFPDTYQEKRILSLTLEDFLSTDDFTNLNSIQFRTGFIPTPGIDYMSDIQFTTHITYGVKECSPELVGTPETTNTTCSDSNDGTVTLTFDGDVDTANEFQMRYFIYQGDPNDFDTNDLDNAVPPQSYDEILGVNLSDIDGDGNFSGSSDSNLENGNYYILYQEVLYEGINVTVKSGKITPQFTISRPSPVTLSVDNTTQPKCIGETGEVTLSASGGQEFESGTYQFSNNGGTTWQTNPTFSNLAQGQTYTFSVQHVLADGECISSTTEQVTIDQVLNPLTIDSGSGWLQQPSAPNATDGSLRIITNNGTLNFTYELFDTADIKLDEITDSANDSENFTGLGEGSYYVVVTDSNGCSATSDTIVLEAPPIPQLQEPTTTAPSCYNGNDGQASVTLTGTINPYTYRIREGDINSPIILTENGTTANFVINGLNPGLHTIEVIFTDTGDFDTPATVASESFTVGNPAEITISEVNVVGLDCNGSSDGYIEIGISDTGDFEYTHSGLSEWVALPNDNRIPITQPGTYNNIQVRKRIDLSTTCEATDQLTGIFVPEGITVTEDLGLHQDVTDNGGFDGALTIDITGGTTPYSSIIWTGTLDNGGTFSDNTGLLALSGLYAGDYSVEVIDTKGCTRNYGPIRIDEPGPLTILSFTGTDVTCNGLNDGTLTATVQGTLPVTYTFILEDGSPNGTVIATDTNSDNTATLTGVPPGTYSLSVEDTDVGTLYSTTDVIIEEPTPISATIDITPSCPSIDNGTITITNVLGGTLDPNPNYSYSIDNGVNFQNSNVFTDVPVGDHIVVIEEDGGCTYTQMATITSTPSITWDEAGSTITDVSAQGLSDGSIEPVFNGGLGNLSFVWTGPNVGGITDQNIYGLGPGTYSVTVTDDNGCSLVQSFEITEPGPLSIVLDQANDISCFGADDGSILTTVTGEAPINYTWTEVGIGVLTTTAEDDIENLPPGTYTLTVTDASTTPAFTSAEITLTEPTQLTAQAFTTDVTCFGAEDGGVVITPDGGTPGYNYSIDGGINYQNGNSFSGLEAGNHTVRVQDANLCTVDVDFTITEPQPIAITLDLQQSLSAANTTDGAINITAFGGTGALTYTWTGPAGFTPPTDNSDDITDLPGGTYTLVITDDNFTGDLATGCYFSQDFTITEPGELLVSLAQTVFLECNGNDFAEITATVQGGVSPYSLEWFDTTDGSDDLLPETSEIIGGLTAGSYFMRVTDANGIIKDSDPITLTEPDLLEITLENTINVLCNGEETGAIDISVSGGTMPYEFYWSNGANSEDITDLAAGEYTIEVVDANSCSTDLAITVSAPDNPLEISNATLTDASEYQAMDGRIVLEISGGQPAYDISWTRASDGMNLGSALEIQNLGADMYTVVITDGNGCSLTETYGITEPDIVEETIIPPICAGESNGSISLLVNQGNGSFTYSWSTGAATNSIANLPAGEYSVTITGLPNGTIERTYILEDPLPLNVDLGDNRVLCAEQELLLDATVEDATATYSWTSDNGFISAEPFIVVSEKGDYTVTVQSATGCTATGSISIDKSSDEISAELAVSSQVFVGETAVLVDISYPLPETTEWILPEGAQVLLQDSDEAEIVFAEAGEYQVGILTKIGECMAQQTKTIIVVANDPTIKEDDNKNGQRLVEDFLVYPNPTDGRFTADVNLTERGNISIKIFSLANNALMASEKGQGQTAYSIPFDISGLPSGVYAVLLETPYGNSLRKIIVR
ncbi:T9SS type A sorting domain-containing protein [Maribacter luteus]|uniref:T9SS type A sorting domain-containing protein n=1 Tax=Maribacter luteus TaxID=2594478 RepID=UPI002491EA34|nr:T9SS type A sorting domain-containing protein [Maribacter luteus]